jgi:uncharacterized repeat protein (TIGR03943 family)
VNRQAQGMLLFVAGGAVIRASLTGDYLRYVKAGLRPYLIVTGVVLMITAVTTIWYALRKSRAGNKSGHAHREPWIAWLLLLPVLALVVVVPPALGSYAADRTGTVLRRPPGFPDLPPGDPVQLSVPDYATRAVYDHGRSLANRHVVITGFITVAGRDTPVLTRMVLNCCAADAQPVKVGLSGKVPSGLRPDTWFEIVGTYTGRQIKDDVNGQPIPFIDVSQARQVATPHFPYES